VDVSSIFTKQKINKLVAGKYYSMLFFEFHETNSDELNEMSSATFRPLKKYL